MKNASRFIGFTDIYEFSRPAMPIFPIKTAIKYLGKTPNTVVDLGCGTGLSTIVWNGYCKKVIGIEPSDDMRNKALTKSNENITFIKGYSHETGLDDNSIDIVVCSQSFHWMEPVSTLKEINRILLSGGVFATVDCDWPPVSDWKIDKTYIELFDKVHNIENTNHKIKDSFIRYDKNKHLLNIVNSNLFIFAREVVFSNTEKCTADRLIQLAMSQGSLQNILKNAPELIIDDVEKFKSMVNHIFETKQFDIDISYRMRIAVK